MKNLPFALAVLLLFAIAGCGPKGSDFSGARVATNTHLIGGQVDSYVYENGKVIQINHSTGDKTYYSYIGDTVLMQDIIGGTVVSNGTLYTLGGDKYADTAIGLYQSQNNAASFLYNPDGQVWQMKSYSHGSLLYTYNYLISLKNVTIITALNPTNGSRTYTYIDYSTTTNTIGNQNFGMEFLGVGTTYMPTKRVTLDENYDTLGVVYYRWRNNTGNIDTLTTYDRNGHVIDSLAYSY